jgi:hypothetical protein
MWRILHGLWSSFNRLLSGLFRKEADSHNSRLARLKQENELKFGLKILDWKTYLAIIELLQWYSLIYTQEIRTPNGLICLRKVILWRLWCSLIHRFLTWFGKVSEFSYNYYNSGHYPWPVLLKHNISETGFCRRLQVEPTQMGPIERATPCLQSGDWIGTAWRPSSASLFNFRQVSKCCCMPLYLFCRVILNLNSLSIKFCICHSYPQFSYLFEIL